MNHQSESPFFGLSMRQPPSNVQAEQALLGGILANNSAYGRVAEYLRAEHFADPIHRQMFAAIEEKIGRGEIADPITLKATFEHAGTLDEVGGTAYLAQLITAMVSPRYVEGYGQAIHDAWKRREALTAAEAMMNAAFDGSMDIHEGVGRAVGALELALDSGQAERQGIMLDGAWGAAEADAEAAQHNGGVTGLSTGFPSLDAVLGGMNAQEMIVLGARPGMGKSALALQIGINAAKQLRDAAKAGGERKGVLVESLEMEAKQLGRRAIAAVAGVPIAALKAGRHAGFASQIVTGRREVHDLPMLIEDMPGQTVRQLHMRARAAARRFGKLGLIIVDHMHIVRPETADAKNGGTWAVGQISNALKRMAKEFECPVLALAQLSRGVEGRDDKRPTLADLRYSGEIEQDADAIMFLYREEYYLPKGEAARKPGQSHDQYAASCRDLDERRAAAKGVAEVVFAKVRDGEPQTKMLNFDGPTTSFREPLGVDDAQQGRWA